MGHWPHKTSQFMSSKCFTAYFNVITTFNQLLVLKKEEGPTWLTDELNLGRCMILKRLKMMSQEQGGSSGIISGLRLRIFSTCEHFVSHLHVSYSSRSLRDWGHLKYYTDSTLFTWFICDLCSLETVREGRRWKRDTELKGERVQPSPPLRKFQSFLSNSSSHCSRLSVLTANKQTSLSLAPLLLVNTVSTSHLSPLTSDLKSDLITGSDWLPAAAAAAGKKTWGEDSVSVFSASIC